MADYLFQGNRDSQGQEGPTQQKLVDRAAFQQDKTNALESLFDVAAPLGMYSGEAQGSINPLTMLQQAKLGKALQKGANERMLFEDEGIVRSGQYDWGKFEPDPIKQSFRDRFTAPNPHGLVKPKGAGSMSLQDIFDMKIPGGANAKIDFKELPPDIFALATPAGIGSSGVYRPSNLIEYNTERLRKPAEHVGTIQHEYQHILDKLRGLSAGANPKNITQRSMQKSGHTPDTYDATQHYLHNIGEVRARQNDMLNNNPGMYTDISSVFRNIRAPYYPHKLW